MLLSILCLLRVPLDVGHLECHYLDEDLQGGSLVIGARLDQDIS